MKIMGITEDGKPELMELDTLKSSDAGEDRLLSSSRRLTSALLNWQWIRTSNDSRYGKIGDAIFEQFLLELDTIFAYLKSSTLLNEHDKIELDNFRRSLQ